MGEDFLRVRSCPPFRFCVFSNVVEIQDLVLSLGQPVSISTSEMFSSSATSTSNPVSPIFRLILASGRYLQQCTDNSMSTALRVQ